MPDHCAIEIDIRTLPGQSPSAIIEQFNAVAAEMAERDPEFKAEVSVLRIAGAIETPADVPFVKAVCQAVDATETGAVGFTTDGPYFAPLGPVLIYGPGMPELCHKPDEYVEVDALERGKRMYQRIFGSV